MHLWRISGSVLVGSCARRDEDASRATRTATWQLPDKSPDHPSRAYAERTTGPIHGFGCASELPFAAPIPLQPLAGRDCSPTRRPRNRLRGRQIRAKSRWGPYPVFGTASGRVPPARAAPGPRGGNDCPDDHPSGGEDHQASHRGSQGRRHHATPRGFDGDRPDARATSTREDRRSRAVRLDPDRDGWTGCAAAPRQDGRLNELCRV